MTTLRRRNNSERDIEFRTGSSEILKGSFTSKVLGTSVQDHMAYRDRTGEFMTIVKNKLGKLRDSNVPSKRSRHIKGIEAFTNFMEVATQIGREINNTYTKLEKLTLLAKRRSLFEDKPVEIIELTYIIKEDINNLNKQIAQLQSAKSRNMGHGKHMVSHSNSVVVSLQSKLASMSNDFRQVLELRTENLKHENERREQFTEGTVSATLPTSAISEHTGSVLLSDDQAGSVTHGDIAINMDSEQFQQQLIDQQDTYIENRAHAMQNIEATIVELGAIFEQLALMVKEQEDLVQRIDSNVEETQLNVEGAHSEILRYFQSVTSNRWLMIKIFAVLMIFFIIFVVFVA